MIRKTYSTE